ncbi:MAG: hypothetical protein J0H85_11335 [Sediminibacterium magnilacihabitans]|jgi:hypothetical protein|nr:hypothetical protein [Sediminibacterium magnilacihabitans]PQV60853.1 hypothetical protein CLV53_105119 [Sediminibacterium magnilacihabitans]
MDQYQPIENELNSISPLLAGLQRRTVFSVPAGYFDGLADRIMQKIRLLEEGKDTDANELADVAPLLHAMARRNVYTVPKGYFEQTIVQPPARVVSMHRPRKWMRYAAAAALTGAIGTGIFFASRKEQAGDYEKYTKVDVSSAIDKVSDTELVNYLDKNERLTGSVDQTMVTASEELPDLSKHISQYSDEELKEFLDENKDLELVKETPGGE